MRSYLFFMMLPLYVSADICDPLMCFDRQGNCIKIALKELNQTIAIEATRFTKDRGWLEPQILSDAARAVISKPLFQVNDQGMLTVVWQSMDLQDHTYLEAAVYSEPTN